MTKFWLSLREDLLIYYYHFFFFFLGGGAFGQKLKEVLCPPPPKKKKKKKSEHIQYGQTWLLFAFMQRNTLLSIKLFMQMRWYILLCETHHSSSHTHSQGLICCDARPQWLPALCILLVSIICKTLLMNQTWIMVMYAESLMQWLF